MAFDGLVVKSLVNELNSVLSGGKINKIYEPNKNELILDIYNKNKFLLNISIESSNCRINLTKYPKTNPKVAPNFCMLLRKYLIGSKITSFQSYNLDRIIIIDLENYNELNDLVRYRLIVELMGKHSNIILINDNNLIIDSLRHIASSQALRITLPANPYTFPDSDKLDLLKLNKEEFINLVNSYQRDNLINTFSKLFTGISKSFMIYTLDKLKIPPTSYSIDDLNKLYNYIFEIINCNNCVCETFELNNKKDFAISAKCVTCSDYSINEFIDEFYFEKENKELFLNYRDSVLKLILSILNKYNKKLVVIQEKLNECNEMEKYKLYGELITTNLYKINNNINVDNLLLENYYENNNLISIPLDKKISPSLNAKKYFKKYNKLKNTFAIVSNQKAIIKKEIDYIESIVYSIENSNTVDEINEIHQEIEENILGKTVSNNNKKSSNNITSIEPLIIDNFTIYIGKNNTQNDIITFKKSDKKDIWFHVQDFHGSHVLLKTNGKDIEDDNPIIKKCAQLAALHSKAINEKKVAVDYTLIKNIKKPKGSKPGFVIFNEYKTIIVENI